jgi:quercetin dioxygenase-like cupin family protein
MLHKFLTITLLVACNGTMNALQDSQYQLATTPVTKESALQEMSQAGYSVEEKNLIFKGNSNNGANFIDAIIPQTNLETGETIEIRVVYYQPGGYVGDHTHDETEVFHVTRGGCKVFILEKNKIEEESEEQSEISPVSHDESTSWSTFIKKSGDDIIIPAHTRHALIAGRQGLCMHIARNDMTRSVDFTKTSVQPWEQD